MDLGDHLLGVFLLFWINRGKRVKKTLVGTGCNEAPFDAELVHRASKTKTIHQHADRSKDGRFVDKDLVGSDRHVVAARCADILHHDVQRNIFVQGTQTTNFIINVAGLYGAAAGTVDSDHDTVGIFVLKCRLQRQDDLVGGGL